ncbi:MAG: DNA polymerase III subunit beta [Eubacterium sp.]|jgi:DNA polymerase-3 subunit beta|nr:DNA polymerase III subunit beta [Eubacterium sp.]
MKFKAEKNRLSEAIINASKACAVKTIFNALDGVLLNLEGDVLTVTGYDLEIGIRIKIKVEGLEDGEIVVDARLFGDMIRRMPSDCPIEISVYNEKDVSINAGKVKLNINGVSSSNFPNIIELNESVNFKLKEAVVKNMLYQISHAIAQNDINPALMGARFDIEDGILYVVASDGMRLALRKEKINYNNISFILPEKTVTELIRNLSDSYEEENFVTVIIDHNQICFLKENYIIFSRLLDGKFIDYNRIINFQPNREVKVNCRDMIYSLERSLLLITEKYKSPVICSLSAEGGEIMKISCKTNLGSFEENIDVKHSVLNEFASHSKEFSIAFNPRFMIDALKSSGCDEVKISIMSELSPIKISSVSEGDFVFIVVPVRLK